MDPRKVCLGEVVAPGIIFLFGNLAFMYFFRLLIPLAEQVEHGDRNVAGICGTQTEGSIDIHCARAKQREHHRRGIMTANIIEILNRSAGKVWYTIHRIK